MALVLLLVVAVVFTFAAAFADVSVPDTEFEGYFDSSGIYTVVGVVKNTENYAVVSHVDVTVNDGGKMISAGQDLPPVAANKDMPFKIRIPQVTGTNPVLGEPSVTFRQSDVPPPSDIHVLYDKTLVRHDDGHLTGRITNDGNKTEYNIRVYAAIHGANNTFLDTGINVENIDKIDPGQVVEFTIYPDPSVASGVNYYSCFNIGDETIVPLYAMRDGERFNFRYDSTAAFTVNGFDDTGTRLSIYGINSFKIPTYVNFEFPRTSDSEKFDVLVNDKPVKFIQSRDEQGNWHVAFEVGSSTQNTILISGFEKRADLPADEGGVLVMYVIPAVIAIGVGVYLFARKKGTA